MLGPPLEASPAGIKAEPIGIYGSNLQRPTPQSQHVWLQEATAAGDKYVSQRMWIHISRLGSTSRNMDPNLEIWIHIRVTSHLAVRTLMPKAN